MSALSRKRTHRIAHLWGQARELLGRELLVAIAGSADAMSALCLPNSGSALLAHRSDNLQEPSGRSPALNRCLCPATMNVRAILVTFWRSRSRRASVQPTPFAALYRRALAGAVPSCSGEAAGRLPQIDQAPH